MEINVMTIRRGYRHTNRSSLKLETSFQKCPNIHILLTTSLREYNFLLKTRYYIIKGSRQVGFADLVQEMEAWGCKAQEEHRVEWVHVL